MNKRLEILSTLNLLSLILQGVTHIMGLSSGYILFAMSLAIIVFSASVVNLFLIRKEEPQLKKVYLRRIITHIIISGVIIYITLYRSGVLLQ